MKMLLDLGATGNFVSDAMATILKLQVQDDEDFHDLTLANGTIMPTAGYVQQSKIINRGIQIAESRHPSY